MPLQVKLVGHFIVVLFDLKFVECNSCFECYLAQKYNKLNNFLRVSNAKTETFLKVVFEVF